MKSRECVLVGCQVFVSLHQMRLVNKYIENTMKKVTVEVIQV